jgi:uroporphyrinogen decarboxylase
VTPRESLLRLFRRQGYEKVPVQFYLCPALEETYQRRYGTDISWQEHFELPMREVELPGPMPPEPIDWNRYYPYGLKEGVQFDLWGVAHEPGNAAAAHMTRMRHPMTQLQTLEQIQSYPFPDL